MIPVTPYERLVAYDTETHMFSAAEPVPPLVCLTVSDGEDYGIYGGLDSSKCEGLEVFVYDVKNPNTTIVGLNGYFDWLVLCKEYERLGMGTASELELLIYRKMVAGGVRELSIIAKLNAIKHNWLDFDPVLQTPAKFSLAAIALRYLGHELKGKDEEDAWRKRYKELDGVGLDLWPDEAVQYAVMDAKVTWAAYNKIARVYGHSPDELMQTVKGWAMYKSGVWGGMTDSDNIDKLENSLRPRVEETKKLLTFGGVVNEASPLWDDEKGKLAVAGGAYKKKDIVIRVPEIEAHIGQVAQANGIALRMTPTGKISKAKNGPLADVAKIDRVAWAYYTGAKSILLDLGFAEEPGFSKDMTYIKRQVEDWYTEAGMEVPLTKKGATKTDRETLVVTDVLELNMLAGIGSANTILNTFIPAFRWGTQYPVHPHWNPLVATGRVSVSKPNLNNVPKFGGVRECFVARPGYVLVSSDYVQAELCSLSQICIDLFEFSKMGEAILAGKDLHMDFAAQLMHISYEEAELLKAAGDKEFKRRRDLAKVANFGFPGGQGVDSFQRFARKAGITLTKDEVRSLKDAWFVAYPEIRLYFSWINNQIERAGGEKFNYLQFRSGRIRGGVGYCDGCNTGFQGLTADGAGNAYCKIDRACYYEPNSPLYGSRVFAFIYDEFILEVPEAGASAAAFELSRLMIEGMQEFTPDIPAHSDPEMMIHWSKGSKAVTNSGGLLIPWDLGEGENEDE